MESAHVEAEEALIPSMEFEMPADGPRWERYWVIGEAACELQSLDNKTHEMMPKTQDVKVSKDDGLLHCHENHVKDN